MSHKEVTKGKYTGVPSMICTDTQCRFSLDLCCRSSHDPTFRLCPEGFLRLEEAVPLWASENLQTLPTSASLLVLQPSPHGPACLLISPACQTLCSGQEEQGLTAPGCLLPSVGTPKCMQAVFIQWVGGFCQSR